MNTMQKHKHYQAIRALADGWKVEGSNDNKWWDRTDHPTLYTYSRAVPDSEGWLPWYGGYEAPIEGPVDVVFWNGAKDLGGCKNWRWEHGNDVDDIIKYRPHKEKEEEKPAEPVYEYLWVVKSASGRNFISTFFSTTIEEAKQEWRQNEIIDRCEWSKRPR